MKRKIALSIALAVGLISLSLVSSDPTARAQKPNRSTADSGVMTLGPNQILRITVVNRGKSDSNIRFGRMEYSQGACNGGVCRLTLTSNLNNEVFTLAPGEAASMDIGNTSFGVRGVTSLQNNLDSDCSVIAQIIDAQTGAVVSTILEEWDRF